MAPAGDYAELLVQRATQGPLAPGSNKSWDVMTLEHKRLQVKARVLTPDNSSRQLSPIRSWDFDELVVILFDDHFGIFRAVFVDPAVAKEASKWRDHVNGWILFCAGRSAVLGPRPYLRDRGSCHLIRALRWRSGSAAPRRPSHPLRCERQHPARRGERRPVSSGCWNLR